MYYVYILKSGRDGKLYVGYSYNPKARLEYHNSGKVEATKNRRPLEIIYLEGYLNQQDATTREKFYKTGWGRTHLKKALKNYWATSSVVYPSNFQRKLV